MTMTAHPRQTHDTVPNARRMTDVTEGQTARCGGAAYPHQFQTEQAGVALSRVVCTMCGIVRIRQQAERNAVDAWSRVDYEIADRFYRELVS